MKTFGWLCLVAGISLGLYALNMDVSVAVSYSGGNSFNLPDRVNNIGLMNERQNYLIVAGILCVIGIILIISAKKSEETPKEEISDREKLKALLNQYSYVRKNTINTSTLVKMENISERRKKLGLKITNDNEPDFIHLYDTNTTSNSIIKLLDKIESGDTNENSTSSTKTGIAEELIKLKKLLDDGVLTQSEFDQQKRKLLQ